MLINRVTILNISEIILTKDIDDREKEVNTFVHIKIYNWNAANTGKF